MKRIAIIILTLCMILSAAGCGAQEAPETTPTTDPTEIVLNAADLKPGAYAGSAAFTQGDFSMAWNFTVSFLEDGTFTLVNDAAEEKGAGTWALQDGVYTMTYSDDRTCTFTVLEDGSLEISGALPYGSASIEADKVGGIVLTYLGEADVQTGATDEAALAAGSYAASYTKESAMAGTVVYEYTAQVGEDGTFSYAVTFAMGDTVYDGCAADGTYTLDGGVFTFTDSEGNVTEGTVSAENTLVISLMASQMAKEPYEVTFTSVN